MLSYDKKLERIMKSLIKKSDPVIFDVGANQGDTIDRYRKIFPSGSICSFEPNHKLFELIKNKHSSDNYVFISDLGISNKSEKSKLNISSDHLMSSIEDINYNSEFFRSRSIIHDNTLDINLIKIDDFCEQHNIQSIDILKLNVQGHEPKCLSGAKNLFSKNKIKYIVVELDMGDRYSVNNQFYHIEENMVPYGYSLYDIILIKRNDQSKIQMINAIYSNNNIESKSI